MSHQWSFSTIGGMKRVNLDTGADLLNLHTLDQKLWTALSCPVQDLEIEKQTLALFDSKGDNQIRVSEVLETLHWILGIIKKTDDLLLQQSELPLNAINTDTTEGKMLYASAKIILTNLNKPDADTISVADTADIARIFDGSAFNGDGIITMLSTADEDIKQLINDIITCMGSVKDRSGLDGIDTAIIESFFIECEAYCNWYAHAEADMDAILPFGSKTTEAYQSFQAIKTKVDDYYLRCRLSDFDAAATDILNTLNARIEVIATKDLSGCVDEIASYPIAKIAASKDLSLVTGLNPAWQEAVATFKQLVVESKYAGMDTMSEQVWHSLNKIFAPYEAWQAAKPVFKIESLGLQSIKQKLAGNAKGTLMTLVEKDLQVSNEADSIIQVDKLVRVYSNLYKLLKNFVTFHDFYAGHKAIFQAGTLYIDQRSCDLCIRVNDMNKHNALAAYSGLYLIYCACTNKSTQEQIIIAAALTNGDIDQMHVGMNALFYDREGRDWDATVIKIVDNPISIKQAFWTPYRKVSKFVESQINKFATEKENKLDSDTQAGVSNFAAKTDKLPAQGETAATAPTPAVPFDIGKFVGIFAAISLALGAIGTALLGVVAGFMSLKWWQMPLALAGIMLAISGPAMILAYLKLRKRNLAPLLDANGWAINAKAAINIPFGNTLTHIAALPIGAKVNFNDPFMPKKVPYKLIVLLALVLVIIAYLIMLRFGFLTSI